MGGVKNRENRESDEAERGRRTRGERDRGKGSFEKEKTRQRENVLSGPEWEEGLIS
jgi:hypothetical protein